jgi:hypothetical protein
VKIGYDNNGDGDILDAGDDIQMSDDFNSNVMSLTYDNNGNLTDDGVLHYVYDGWNRLKKVNRYADGDTTTIATYSYLPDNRRASKVVQHCGVEAVANDGGDTTVHFYYGSSPSSLRGSVASSLSGWNIFETRNGSSQSTRQWVWGTQYVDEVLLMDVNGDPASSNICDVDDPNHPTGSRRYFYHQDRNWNVVALTEYDDGTGVNGRVVERYAYTPYGEFVVTKGDGGSGADGSALPTSTIGNTVCRRAGTIDHETGLTTKRSLRRRPEQATAGSCRPPAIQRSSPCATGVCNPFAPPAERSHYHTCCNGQDSGSNHWCWSSMPPEEVKRTMRHWGEQAIQYFCALAPDGDSCCPVPCAPDLVCAGNAMLSCGPDLTCPAGSPIGCTVIWAASYGCTYAEPGGDTSVGPPYDQSSQ